MDKKSIDLCEQTGSDAFDALFEKIRDIQFPVHIGRHALQRITAVEHYEDGLPVISATTAEGDSLTFQFCPDQQPFAQTAVNDDGQALCIPEG